LPQPRNAANSLSERNLGEAISLLYKIRGDPDHPFSEVTGVLQRIERSPEGCIYHLARRSGEVVRVEESDVLKSKVLPPAHGPIRMPKSWGDEGSYS
jgi:hypothetical protein